jgi:Uma2 family endonuclease
VCELVNGVLVEKSYHFRESVLTASLTSQLIGFEEEANLGFAIGPSAAYRVAPGRVRSPDVSFFRWERVPGRCVPDVAIADFPPALTVELNNQGNTAAEGRRKLGDDFAAGVGLASVVDIGARTVDVYTDPDHMIRLEESRSLDGGDVLPGFTLSIRRWFERAARWA